MIEENFIPNPTDRWLNCPATHAIYQRVFKSVVEKTYRIGPEIQGDGIVYVGGGKFWPGIVVGCRLIRSFGCKLPIQVWYRGSCEPINPKAVAGLDVELIDADAMSERLDDNRVPRGSESTGGWEAKTYALTHCPFRRFVYLDADAYCVADPKHILDLLDGRGVAFWEDLPSCENNIRWHAVFPEGKNGVPTFQGGQYAMDRSIAEPILQVAHWMNQNSDFYYKQMFGDQDTLRVALSATKIPYRCVGKADWPGNAFVCKAEGRDLVVHRCQGKLFRHQDIPDGKANYSNPQTFLPLEGIVFDHLADVLNQEGIEATIFENHYQKGLWGGGSGHGSAPPEAEPFITTINAMIKLTRWKSVVDVGCGDGRVANRLDFKTYRGFDCSTLALERFQVNTGGRLQAELLDCYTHVEKLPGADVLLVRDVLHHWPNEWVINWLTQIQKLNRWKTVMLTQDKYQWHDGQNCSVGGYRGLDREMNPLKIFKCDLVTEYLHKSILILPTDGPDE